MQRLIPESPDRGPGQKVTEGLGLRHDLLQAAVWQLPVKAELVLTTGRKAGLLQLSLILSAPSMKPICGVLEILCVKTFCILPVAMLDEDQLDGENPQSVGCGREADNLL